MNLKLDENPTYYLADHLQGLDRDVHTIFQEGLKKRC
jgi:hypothetical protein